jgi:hypothetical protein
MPALASYIGIDYSGAETPTASLKGLCVYLATSDVPPVEVPPRGSLHQPSHRVYVYGVATAPPGLRPSPLMPYVPALIGAALVIWLRRGR